MGGEKPTPVQIIEKKRDGQKLSEADIKAFVEYITASGDAPKMDDSQIGMSRDIRSKAFKILMFSM